MMPSWSWRTSPATWKWACTPTVAALKGAKEIGFTVLTISMSLIAVFIPLLMMGGIVGRLFREFAITLSTAILVSMVISLTTTPMMCAHLLKDRRGEKHGRIYRASERFFDGMLTIYKHSLLLGVGQFGPDADGAVADHRAECGADHQDSQRLFPAAGHRRIWSAACRGRRTPPSRL